MKPFLTYQEQIDLLKQRGISIPSDSVGVDMLSKDNYYRLINGYKDLLLDAVPPDRYSNRSLNDFTALSDFDRGLKFAFLNRLVQIETQFKGVISYEFSRLHGPVGYLDSRNFEKLPAQKQSRRSQRAEEICNWIGRVHTTIAAQYRYKDYISHYFDNHQEIPLWVLVNAMSFGDIVSLYKICKAKTQDAVSSRFKLPSKLFQALIEHLRVVRNVCAHDERLFSLRTPNKQIPVLRIHSDLDLVRDDKPVKVGCDDLFATYISVLHFLARDDARLFTAEISHALRRLGKRSTADIQKVMSKMGFPANWEDTYFLLHENVPLSGNMQFIAEP